MSQIFISYTLRKQDHDYSKLTGRIQELGPKHWHGMDSTWIVISSLSALEVRDELAPLLDASDELLVIDITGDAVAWGGFNNEGSNWLKENC